MTRAIRMFAAALVLTCCMFATTAQAVDVRAWLDRNSMQLGETVTLNVEATGSVNAAEPDFSALRQDFDVGATQSSTSVNVINGQTSAKMLWAVALEPKREGSLTIPSIEVAGQHTQPLALTVLPAAPAGTAGGDVYIETTAEPPAPYVQQQVLLTVKLYFALNLSDGDLDDPHGDGVVVRKLGQDANYSADVGGRRYHVVERHYALLPEKSGAITLPPIAFRGHAIDPGDINSFFSRGRGVGARSQPITLDVRARPAASGNDVWLPARSVNLHADGIDANTKAKVGDPITLTLREKAQGLGFEQLPELKLPKIDGADIYPDKENTQNRDDGTWIYGERERKFAIVPNRPGELAIPPISLTWWDTAHDRAETALLPAQTIEVAAAPSQVTQPAAAIPPSPPQTAAPLTSAPANVYVDTAELRWWRSLALCALVLWALTLAAWIVWLIRQRTRTSPRPAPVRSGDTDVPDFNAACRRADWPGAARALLVGARRHRPGLRNLGELAREVADPEQTGAIRALEAACYGSGAAPDLGQRLLAAFRGGPKFVIPTRGSSDAALPPLYPSATR
ncbi:MAG TPA: BatD family protein [Casimicrobiaceae bacterium]|nr:BatD family protein [Casimicrobiaceae bacterium]